MRQVLRLVAAFSAAMALTSLPEGASASSGRIYLAGFPALKQKHSLTCEASSASMATRARITEGQIMSVLPRDPNPNLGFRGNPDGQQGTRLVDYGVYAAPIHRALQHFGYRNDVLMYGNYSKIASYVQRGWPVITWVTYALQRARPRIAWAGGAQFFLVPHEHTVLVTGYDGSSVVANDPWDGLIYRYSWSSFRRAWGYFAGMAVAVEPCATPKPISQLRMSTLTADGLLLVWKKVPAIDHYRVTVVLNDAQGKDHKIYSGNQPSNHFLLVAPQLGGTYQITVKSVASCGSNSTSTKLWFQVPSSIPTATPPVSPTPTASPKR